MLVIFPHAPPKKRALVNSFVLIRELVSLRLQNERLYIFLFSAAVALLQVKGQRSQLGVKGGGGGEMRGGSQRGVC